MSFFKQLLADAQPRATSIKNVTSNIATNLYHTVPVQAAKNVSYKGLREVTAVGLVVAQSPVVSKVWSFMEELAKPPVSVAVKK